MFHDYTFAAVTSRLYVYSPFDDLTVALSAMSIPKSFKYFRSSRPKKICIVGWDRWAVLEIMKIHTTLIIKFETIKPPRYNWGHPGSPSKSEKILKYVHGLHIMHIHLINQSCPPQHTHTLTKPNSCEQLHSIYSYLQLPHCAVDSQNWNGNIPGTEISFHCQKHAKRL